MLPTEYGTPEGMRTLANWLRSDNGVKVRSGIEHEKRVEYFKGTVTLAADNDVDDDCYFLVVVTIIL